ncbi:MAG: ATP-binding protein [Eggerthellaceae bacterium]|nr:ATP-binding protein [Eggerthellaceae bacterium]
MRIPRNHYLEKLVRKKHNGSVKVVTGVRRCGKSYLLFEIFRDHLREAGVPDEQVIELALDEDENVRYRDPSELSAFLNERIVDREKQHYVLLDEVQLAISREEMRNPDVPTRLYGILNGLLRRGNVDVYVTGSNSKMLSSDVRTEFWGRGDEVEVRPLSFSEYYAFAGGERAAAYEDYVLFGGMPRVALTSDDEDKLSYLQSLFALVYFRDIVERYEIGLPDVLAAITDDLCSSVGSLTNANKISKSLGSVRGARGTAVSVDTVSSYLSHLTESFLFSEAKRYDVKGKRYFDYPSKYYCVDVGLRNARLSLRQQEETHIMENIVYNELVHRGFAVDVGAIEISGKNAEGKRTRKSCEIDFVANKGSERIYIQSAPSMEDETKADQKLRPLLGVNDFFRKVVVSKTLARPWTDGSGVLHIGIYDFLTDGSAI